MADRKHKDNDWEIIGAITIPAATLIVLMDIRDELKRLNGTLNCTNFLAIPRKLDRISHNTAKPRKKQ